MKLVNLLAFGLFAIAPAMADAVVVDGGWYGFCYGGTGEPIVAGCDNEGVGTSGNPVTFTLTGPGTFRITDAFWAGDSFDVYANGQLLLQTPSVAPDDTVAVSNPDLAFADPVYSTGSLRLGPGSYSINVFARDSPFESGGGYLSVVSAAAVGVPEPGALAGLLAASAVSFGVRRRRGTR